MKKRSILTLLAVSFLAPIGAHGQWLDYPDPATPRTADGKPDLSAKAPRTADGHPDLSGIWQPEAARPDQFARYSRGGTNGLGEDDPTIYFLNILDDFKPSESPMLPAVAAAFGARA
jgi:hypothetical protein